MIEAGARLGGAEEVPSPAQDYSVWDAQSTGIRTTRGLFMYDRNLGCRCLHCSDFYHKACCQHLIIKKKKLAVCA